MATCTSQFFYFKVLLEDGSFPLDNIPFVVVYCKVYDCQHGIDRHLCKKNRIKRLSSFGTVVETGGNRFHIVILLSSHKLIQLLHHNYESMMRDFYLLTFSLNL